MKLPKDRKMTFTEFIAWQDSDEHEIDDGWFQHSKKFTPLMLSEENSKEHYGDCTKNPHTCTLCYLETLLGEYKEYFFQKN